MHMLELPHCLEQNVGATASVCGKTYINEWNVTKHSAVNYFTTTVATSTF